jgi:hypothetical protein
MLILIKTRIITTTRYKKILVHLLYSRNKLKYLIVTKMLAVILTIIISKIQNNKILLLNINNNFNHNHKVNKQHNLHNNKNNLHLIPNIKRI